MDIEEFKEIDWTRPIRSKGTRLPAKLVCVTANGHPNRHFVTDMVDEDVPAQIYAYPVDEFGRIAGVGFPDYENVPEIKEKFIKISKSGMTGCSWYDLENCVEEQFSAASGFAGIIKITLEDGVLIGVEMVQS